MNKEIFVGQLPVIRHSFYKLNGLPASVTNPKAIVDTVTYNATQDEAGKLEVILPYEDYSHLEQTINVEWQFDYGDPTVHHKKFDTVDVVTPLAEWDEFVRLFEDQSLEYRDFLKVEQLVREIITAYCGQTFGKYIGSLPAEGNGTDGLITTRRIISVSDVGWAQQAGSVINPNDPSQWVPDYAFGYPGFISYGQPAAWEVAAEGWMIRRSSFYRYQDPTRPEGHTFSRNTIYQVNGVYGWDSVPGAVQKAAALLIEDYLCPDLNYRNKYLDQLKFDQHSMVFNQRAWNGTGNVQADQLLREYRLMPNVGVI